MTVKKKPKKIPYEQRTDDVRLKDNWRKARKQFERGDWSASVMRAATAAEIAANIYVREYFVREKSLPQTIVDELLKSANGLDGKYRKLIRPVSLHRGTWSQMKAVQKKIQDLNSHRNEVAHAGRFRSEKDARDAFLSSHLVIALLSPEDVKDLEVPPDK